MGAAGRRRSGPPGVEAVLALFAGVGTFTVSAVLAAAPLPHCPNCDLGVLCILGVLAVAHFWGIAYAVSVGVASAVALDWYRTRSTGHALHPSDPSFRSSRPRGDGSSGRISADGCPARGARHPRTSPRRSRRDRLKRSRGGAGYPAACGDAGRARQSPAEVFATVTAEVERLLRSDVLSLLRYETDGARPSSRPGACPTSTSPSAPA